MVEKLSLGIGVKPNGKSYIHAGRGGFYYREEFGNNQRRNNTNYYDVNSSSDNTTFYNTATTNSIKSDYKANVVEMLNKSYNLNLSSIFSYFNINYLFIRIFLINSNILIKGVRIHTIICNGLWVALIKFSAFPAANVFGSTSPKITSNTVIMAVATPTPPSPKIAVKTTVVSEADNVFTILLEISSPERVLS